MFKKKYLKNVAKIYKCPESGDAFGLLTINGDMKNKLLEIFRETFIIQGHHVNSGGKASELCIPTLLAGGTGALSYTALKSGSLFMASINPATLMSIGNGFGSAVLQGGKIVAQAPFIPVTGALMPVAAPLLAFQALSTIMILQQFNLVNEKMITIENKINRMLQRNEAIFIGEIISACSRLEKLENEVNMASNFTSDMIVRLALIEDKVNPIFERYKYLYDAQDIDIYLSSEDLKFKQTDANMAIVLSMFDLRIDILRLKLTIQDNPGFLKQYTENLVKKVERYKILWDNIENSPKSVTDVSSELKDTISSMNEWEKFMPSWLGGKRKEKIDMQEQANSLSNLNSYENTNYLVESAQSAAQAGEALNKSLQEKSKQFSLFYWEDEYGKHSYYTKDITIIDKCSI